MSNRKCLCGRHNRDTNPLVAIRPRCPCCNGFATDGLPWGHDAPVAGTSISNHVIIQYFNTWGRGVRHQQYRQGPRSLARKKQSTPTVDPAQSTLHRHSRRPLTPTTIQTRRASNHPGRFIQFPWPTFDWLEPTTTKPHDQTHHHHPGSPCTSQPCCGCKVHARPHTILCCPRKRLQRGQECVQSCRRA